MKIRLAMENNEFNSIQLRRGQNGTKCSEGVTRLYLLRKPRPMRRGGGIIIIVSIRIVRNAFHDHTHLQRRRQYISHSR